MRTNAARLISANVLFVLSFSIAVLAQGATLSGLVKDSAGAPVPHANVSLKNLNTGKTVETQADAQGAYRFVNVAPDNYEITAGAIGFTAKTEGISMTATPQTADISFAATEAGPSLSDLGFPTAETKSNPEEQARLDKRTHMLKIHQKMGLITTGPLLATIISGFGAGGKKTSSSTRDSHAALGSATAGL